eukprot:CAMPEP_0116036456 /NCGR_PEP_ID=MMETSP0321-20121206/21221_1 /TAXON_ID=163516 /ORGANISM="Leptocylindrus danicus var. danicus, Strain B650" /LENGTH=398 /DNA_ID=CAMNT_0003513977 /DNA_START=36 /DNA_END=1232 /DNA_ORIENTATION=+
MDNFFKNLGNKNKSKEGSKKPNFKNPFERKFKGSGSTLGGSKPGTLVKITFSEPGSLGLKVEKTASKGTIVSSVVPGGQAEKAGLRRGDVLCFGGSEGEEVMFDHFLILAKEESQRPLEFEVLRIEVAGEKANKNMANSNTAAAQPKGRSAQDEQRRKAVIAAAAAREKAHKDKTKPIAYKTKTSAGLNDAKNTTTYELPPPSSSEASKKAVMEAKARENATASALGYNPYEVVKSGSGTSRTAVVDSTHGSIEAAEQAQTQSNVNNVDASTLPAPGKTSAPPDTTDETIIFNEQFDEAVALILSNEEVGKRSLSTMRKLILNAVTKGQTDEKFRKVRLGNARIQKDITDVHGALEVMMMVGFELVEQDEESLLMYPPDYVGPDWLSAALDRMERLSK